MQQETSTSLELVQRLRRGDAGAYQLIVDQWQHRVFNFALRYSNDQYFANEVVQKTFIQVFEKIDQLKDPAKLKSWLYKIASNNCCNEGRLKSRVSFSVLDDQVPQRADFDTPARSYEKAEMKALVEDVLQKIPPEQRQVIIMKEYEGLKFREIAEILGESENTVKSRMYYGLDAMRKILLNNNLSKDIYHE
ncbi:MAG: sigma-70 family RNA polymerase sigma factor [Saprospiraceae bacterium]|nr:sigma-70 family RNA polymerase sigma factor [Saprospiraceae bacterium]